MADLASDVAADRTADLSTTDKIGEAMRRSLPLLPGEAQGVVLDMLKPENLAIIGAAVVVWAASQFFGVGEFVDFILLVVGIRALGFSVLTGARELYYFVTTAVNATSSQDLDVAGQHFAQAVLILGISVVQAVLLRGAANKVVAPSRPQVKPRIQETDPPPNAPNRVPVPGDADFVGPLPGPTGPVQKLEVGSYQDLRSRAVVGDGLEHDHIPSFAALRTAAEAENGGPLTAEELNDLYNNATAVEVPRDVHIDGPTFGGKNTPNQIAADAANLPAAIARDIKALRDNLISRGYDPAIVEQTIQKIIQRNTKLGLIQ